jgi:hypothetical protein
MSNGKTTAEADVTVFNLSNMLRLAVVEVGSYLTIRSLFISSKDKRYSAGKNANDGQAQLVAEAIAASMYNRERIAQVRYI